MGVIPDILDMIPDKLGARPDQTRPDQTRPDQTRPDQTRPDRNAFLPSFPTSEGVIFYVVFTLGFPSDARRFCQINFIRRDKSGSCVHTTALRHSANALVLRFL